MYCVENRIFFKSNFAKKKKKHDFHTSTVKAVGMKGLPLMLVVHFVIIAQLMLKAFFRKMKMEFCWYYIFVETRSTSTSKSVDAGMYVQTYVHKTLSWDIATF